jgi:hypothetical protein
MTDTTYHKVLELNGFFVIKYVKNWYLMELAYDHVQLKALVLAVQNFLVQLAES